MLVLLDVRAEVGSGALSVALDLDVLVERPLLVQLLLVLRKHVLLVFTDDGFGSGVDMLGVQDLVVLDRLDTVLKRI